LEPLGLLPQRCAMRIVRSPKAMQRIARAWQRQGVAIGFVPTMGYLHYGHLGLVDRARQAVGPRGRLVVSIFVNPTQFGPKEDLGRYPRDLARDRWLCRKAGVDLLFVPSATAMYGSANPADPSAGFSTWVVEETLSRGMEGLARPGHFRGVTTVVSMLFHLVWPDVAVFGAKDYQQAAVIRRMIRDLHFPVKLLVSSTSRESDGLAMSSRNKYLSGDLREQARVLSQALEEARQAVRRSGRPLPAARLRRQLWNRIEQAPAARVEYIEFFNPETLAPVRQVRPRDQAALAVYIGKTRLIDNVRL
ncbi:MAG TPA: pantoate--beta-alanine ligase, partial [Candidatus Dormibacteraeota bacterium]|nr:pantoate--beta-alanine ligase [Candidatus Dormibacteraeota bacterium]